MFKKNEMVTFELKIFLKGDVVYVFLPVARSVLEKYLPEVSEAAEVEGRETLLRLRGDIFFSTGPT